MTMLPHRITLLPINADMGSLFDGDRAPFEERYGVTVGDGFEMCRGVVRQTIEFEARVPREAKWGGFLVVDEERRAVVGMCGYKSAPTAEGEIEIAYGTLPVFEGQGYATATAAELTRRALADGAVKTVIAHTLAMRNASGRVLEKNGFRFSGEAEDPEDGPVWRWERAAAGVT